MLAAESQVCLMTAAFWLVPALLLTAGGGGAVNTQGRSCEKKCEKRYVPCSDARVDQQMMCFEVQKRCELICEPSAKPARIAKGRRVPPRR